MIDIIVQRISGVPVLTESRAALEHLVEHDWTDQAAVEDRRRTGTTLEQIFKGLGATKGLQPFLNAWLLLRAALLHLDHVQDNDPTTLAIRDSAFSAPEQYNLILTYYVLSMAQLDELDDAIIPGRRIRRVIRLWNDSMLVAGSGQQRDLARSGPRDSVEAVLEHYMETIEAKAGAVYALGLGGVALLSTDDQQQFGALSLIGRIFGTLLQFSDDMLDAGSQSSEMLTLPQVYAAAVKASGLDLPPHNLAQYWSHMYMHFFEQVQQTLPIFPSEVQEAILGLFRSTFDS